MVALCGTTLAQVVEAEIEDTLELSNRKNIRLKDYDYSQNGACFITIYVKDRHELLGAIVGTSPSLHDFKKLRPRFSFQKIGAFKLCANRDYLLMPITTPEPTVRPPSRIAKRRPSSMAMGVISWTSISTLSPGMHISMPSGREMTPVTSVVRK